MMNELKGTYVSVSAFCWLVYSSFFTGLVFESVRHVLVLCPLFLDVLAHLELSDFCIYLFWREPRNTTTVCRWSIMYEISSSLRRGGIILCIPQNFRYTPFLSRTWSDLARCFFNLLVLRISSLRDRICLMVGLFRS